MSKPRVIAFYLPQYHPIPENDEWWAKGFTEWMHVAGAKPLFPGHRQPRLPGELGFYDLRLAEFREKQAAMAKSCGIEGFCYWHYWLGNGRRLLERPFEEILEAGAPDIPFCLAWANHDWSGLAFGAGRRLLAKQEYPGAADYEAHFQFLNRAFKDPRYIRVDGKPLLYIYKPKDIPDCKQVMEQWRKRAREEGHSGLYLVGEQLTRAELAEHGLDAIHHQRHRSICFEHPKKYPLPLRALLKLNRKTLNLFPNLRDRPLQRFDYEEAVKYMLLDHYEHNEFPNIVPNWDTTPRLGRDAVIFENATPDRFRRHVRDAFSKVDDHPAEQKIVFLRAWNEWAEGNYLEPDEEYGSQKMDILREELARLSVGDE